MRSILALLVCGWAIPAGAAELMPSAAFAVAPECSRAGAVVQRNPAGCCGKSVYLVAWCDGSRQIHQPTADIYCARIDATSGKVLDPKGIRVCAAADLQEHPAIAFDGTHFLIAWQDFRNGKDYDIYAARVSEDGKVLDPDGFAVSARPSNQARPAVTFAGGHFLVVWMDARQYPVYGLYGARVSPDGKVLDPDGRLLDGEKPEAIAKVRPPSPSWLGDRHHWWSGLQSRFHPSIATNGKEVTVTCLRDINANNTSAQALRLDPSDLSVLGLPVKLPGQPRDRLACCPIPDGWAVSFDHWVSGWSPTPRLTALRLDANLQPRDDVPLGQESKSKLPPAPLLDLQKVLADKEGDYQQGKGHFSFWQSAATWNGREVVVAMDYGWRTKQKLADLHYAIVVTRYDVASGRFLDDPPLVAATGASGAGTSVENPVLVAGPNGDVLLLYEHDTGIDSLKIEGRFFPGRGR